MKSKNLMRRLLAILLTALMLLPASAVPSVLAAEGDFIPGIAPSVPVYYLENTATTPVTYRYDDSSGAVLYRVYGALEDDAGAIDPATAGFYESDATGAVTGLTALDGDAEFAGAKFTHAVLAAAPSYYTPIGTDPVVYTFQDLTNTAQYRVYGSFINSPLGFYISDVSGAVTDADSAKTHNDGNNIYNPGGIGGTVLPELRPNEAYVFTFDVDSYITGTPGWDTVEERGNDISPNDMIVRSFDSVTYMLNYSVNLQNQTTTAYFEEGDMYIKFVLPDTTKDKANFDISGMLWLVDPVIQYNVDAGEGVPGANDLVLTGKYRMKPSEGVENSIPGSGNLSAVVDVFGMNNGDTLAPVFYAWMDGYDTATGNAVGQNSPKRAVANDVTVSAKLALNVQLTRNSYVSELGLGANAFDFDTGLPTAVNNGEGPVEGRLFAYGLSVAIANSDPTRGFKGLELPVGPITFDIELDAFESTTATTSPTSESILYKAMPLVWALSPNGIYWSTKNETDGFLTPPSPPVKNPMDRNMHWPTPGQPRNLIGGGSHADRVPFNSGNRTSVQYHAPDGGVWTIESDSTDLNIYHVTVDNYGFVNTDPGASNYGEYQWPLRYTNSDANSGLHYGESLGTGVFSAGT